MIDWTKGYSTTWRVSRVDPVTWASMGEVPSIVEASYSADATTDAVETATAKCVLPFDAEPLGGWLRIEALLEQGTAAEHVTVCTMRFDAGGSTWRGGYRTDTLQGVSSLYPASEAEKLPDGAWAEAMANGADRVASLIAPHTPAPIYVDGSYRIDEGTVYDLDSTPLAAALSILPDGWAVRPDAYGAIHVTPASAPVARFGTADRGMFLTEASSDSDGRITYTRQWGPGLRVHDAIGLKLPELGLDGDYRIVRQNVTCGSRITVEETVEAI